MNQSTTQINQSGASLIDVEHPVHIVYGTQTGTAENIAYELTEASRAQGVAIRISDMEDLRVEDLQQSQCLIIVTSTYGDGDMPDNAVMLWNELTASSLDFSSTAFAVLGLGDSSFPNFCAAGRNWDHQLEKLGAQRLIERVDCDNDYEESADAWQASILSVLEKNFSFAKDDAKTNSSDLNTEARSRRFNYDQSNPMIAELVDKRLLTAKESSKQVMHYALRIPVDEQAYQPGDILNILPHNEVALVNAILFHQEFDCESLVTYKNEDRRLGELLSGILDIRVPSMKFLESVASETADIELQELLHHPEQLSEFLWGKDVLSFLEKYPDLRLSAQNFVDLMRPLTPRSYSIASSPSTFRNEVHLTVSTVSYKNASRPMYGTGSGYLANKAEPGNQIACYLQANRHFTLPEDDSAPIVMIGPGTGIAPFRCFLQERESRGATGKNWLFFGDRNRETDFLYAEELEEYLANNLLTRLDCAFSRDQQDKTYVQHRMIEQADQLFQWLEDGAYVFVCGDAQNMAKDVEKTLIKIIETGGTFTESEAQEYLDSLRRSHRYERDVY